MRGAVPGNLAVALEPFELGLAAGIGALVTHRWLFARCENLEREMKNATLDLANELSRLARA
jgi:biopolymer transport protein ExbB/TolQ